MTTNIFTAKYFFNCACRDFGLEDEHTIAIGKILEAKEGGYLEADYADSLAKLLYNDGLLYQRHIEETYESLEFVGDPDEEFDGFIDYSDESGFDPYMGCYTGDC